jgi:hypothetical protein
MDIRFVSSLTAEDENMIAPALLKAAGALLDQLPIAYTLRIETTGAQVLQHTHTGPAVEDARATSSLAAKEVGWGHSADDRSRTRPLPAASFRR